jgi:hypothetical protein
MKRLAIIATLGLALASVAAPAMASEPVPGDQSYSLTDAPVDPAPSHHKIKPPAPGKGDLYELLHGGFNDATSTDTSGTDYAATAQERSSAVLLKSGIIVAKVAKAKAIKQPKQPKQKTAKAAKQPKQAAAKAPTHSKTTKATTVKPPVMTVQQATQLAFAAPPKVRKVKLH